VLAHHESIIVIVIINNVGGGGACNTGVCMCIGCRVLELSNEIIPFLEEGRIECISALNLGGVVVIVIDMVNDGIGSGVVKISGRYFT